MRIPYKVVPINPSAPGFLNEQFHWVPVLLVRLIVDHTPTVRFEAVVDSGAASCLFHASLGRMAGLKVEKGVEDSIRGIISGTQSKVYYHGIKLAFADQFLNVTAGFSDELSVAGILGRRGFFDNFAITFDPSSQPPGMEIQRMYSA